MIEGSSVILDMQGVGFFGILIVWFLAGYIAEHAMNRDHSLLTNILVGIAGSFVGNTLADLLDIHYYGFAGNLLITVVGAVILLWIFGRLQSIRPR